MSKKCLECNKDYDGYYCTPCNSGHFRDHFQKWTSGDDDINDLIRESQLNASHSIDLLEWIEYSNLKNIKNIAEGGFGTVYKAVWKDGPITEKKDKIKDIEYQWEVEKSEWI